MSRSELRMRDSRFLQVRSAIPVTGLLVTGLRKVWQSTLFEHREVRALCALDRLLQVLVPAVH